MCSVRYQGADHRKALQVNAMTLALLLSEELKP